MGATERQIETLETLAGRRPRARRQAAVTITDMEALLALPAKLRSMASAGEEPTKAEFDALVDDVANLHARLVQIAMALQARILP